MLQLQSKVASCLFSSKFWMIKQEANALLAQVFFAGQENYLEIPTYQEETNKMIESLKVCESINITTNFTESDIPENSIAFHRIHGVIFADEDIWSWYFSTKRFRKDLIAADNNPQIIAHFISVKSGGGEAWFLDVAAETVKNLKKPVIAHTEKFNASAALYLSIYASKIYAATPNETIGSVGTMVSFFDLIPYFEKEGLVYVEEYAHQSDLKNKKYNDLRTGKPEQYIKEELDPLADQFINTIIDARPQTAKLDKKKHPLFRGETFDTSHAISLGLIDGQMLMDDAIQEADSLGREWKEKQKKIKNAFSLIN